MEKRRLGRTGLEVSSLGLGCVTFGREIDAATSFAILDHARENGINMLDTAAAYHGGESERVLGAWLKDRNCRSEVVVATKVHLPLTGEHLRRSLEESLERLGLDEIDLFQFHAWDDETPLEESLAALEELREAGLIRHAGCSNWTASQLKEATRISDVIATIQPPYNLVQREIEIETLPFCATEEIGVLSYSPLAAGFLTGKYRPGGEVPEGTRFEVIPGHQPIYFTNRGWGILEGLRKLSEQENQSMISLALGWTMSQPGIDCVLVGARHTGHIDQALAAASSPLAEECLSELTEISSL